MLIGLIAEFNPFHKGHKHLVDSVKNKNNNIISIMSGDYVVRGEFAIYNKFLRAKSAYNSGVDAVFELVSLFSLQNAQNFSFHAINHLLNIGIDALIFGAENPDLEFLNYSVDIVKQINHDFRKKKLFLKDNSYSNFIKKIIFKETNKTIGSNDMLALEYITQLREKKSNIKILPIQRIVSDFNTSLNTGYSASAIRKDLLHKNNLISNACIFSLIKTIGVLNFIDTEGLSISDINKIYKSIFYAKNYEDIITQASHKRLSRSRIQRALLKSVLQINSSLEKKYCNTVLLKPLAINKSNNILKSLDKSKLFTKFKDVDRLGKLERELYFLNEKHSEFYQSFSTKKSLLDRTSSPFI